MIAIHNSIPSKLISCDPTCEFLSVEISVIPAVILCCVYIPPNCHDRSFLDYINSIGCINYGMDVVILGDFNAPDVNWSSLSASTPSSTTLCDVVFRNNLLQVVSEPTHVLGNTLDLILTNSPDRIANIVVSSPALSDHSLITFDLFHDSHLVDIHGHGRRSVSIFSKADHHSIARFMDNACLQFPILDTNCFWVCLRDLIMSACDLFIPKFSISAKSSPRWFNGNIRHSLNQIHTLRRSIRRNSSAQKLAKLSDLETMLEDLIISSKVEYESHIFSSFASNPKKTLRSSKFSEIIFFT